jgi:RNA polymerase sigma factor (sigma-70 family)
LAPTARTALEELFREHHQRIHASIRRKLGRTLRRRIESGDVLQEVFAEALRLVGEGKADAGMDRGAFLAWVSRIVDHRLLYLARRHVKSLRRSVSREVKLEPEADGFPGAGTGKTPSEELSELEEAERLRRACARLAPRERQVVELVYFQRLKVAEAAARMGKTPNATSVLLRKAVVKLGEFLKRKER